MGCMKLGSKADVFHLEGQSWLCTNGLPSDVCVKVGETSFHLHKFPLLSRSQLFDKLIQDHSISHKSKDERDVLSLNDLPGGAETFLLIAKFCYGVKFEITAVDIVREGNLISKTEVFLDEVLRSWADTLTVLKTCEEAPPLAEELHIISRCIDFLATKAYSEPTLSHWHMPGRGATWNGIPSTSKSCLKTDAWWYKDVAILKLPLFKRLIMAIGSKGLPSDRISGALFFYANCYLPLNCRQSSFRRSSFGQINPGPSSFSQINPGPTIPDLSDADQRMLIEEIIGILPDQKGAAPTNFLLQLLRTSMILHASASFREILERRIVAQLDQAVLEDLLILNAGYYTETFYAIECVERMFNNFSFVDHDSAGSNLNSVEGDDQSGGSSHSVTPTTIVGNLLDDYLAEVAPYVNLKLEQFMSLAGSIPDYARPLDDGLYRAIDRYLQMHSRLTDSEKERLCKLINCEKLSEEARKHVAQNDRLPMRFVLQVLLSDQQRIEKSMSRRFFVPNNPKNSRNSSRKMARKNNPTLPSKDILKLTDMREQVLELEQNCEDMKQEMVKKKKPVKTRGGWSNFCKGVVGLSCKPKSGNHQDKAVIDGKKDHQSK
ncbi:hypothetical protein CDL12_18897 [Handroanthus impetiginosus]|uniref:NPH3 domain-containing protein n=1 Tax=Handroanthus impetiginosus TaxID=429701 RepID=A0A2G9GTA3_9LAMI|nr:hypothetical protein CDL12_18897 [Handroanthus impetiginosus]